MPATSSLSVDRTAAEPAQSRDDWAGPDGINPPALAGNGAGVPVLPADIAATWLSWQCRMVAGIIRGVIYPVEESGRLGNSTASWPAEGEGESLLMGIAVQSFTENRGVIRANQHYGPGSNRVCDMLATPLSVDGEVTAVVAAMITTRSSAQQHAVLQLLQWGSLWVETLLHQHLSARREAGSFVLSLLTSVVAGKDLEAATVQIVNHVAARFECERVSIGLRRGLRVSLRAISQLAVFDSRTELARRIEAAMEEAVDQGISICLPGDQQGGESIQRAHTDLRRHQGALSLCTVPLPGPGGFVGALTLERPVGPVFDEDTIHWLESLAKLVGPVLHLKRRDERPVFLKLVDAGRGIATAVLGLAHLRLKLSLLGIVLLLVAASLITVDYRITASAAIEGAVQQVLVAPQPGFVREASARAGDVVQAGQLLALLDDRDLLLEQDKWQGERNKLDKEYQDALAHRDRTKLSVLQARIEQASAELALVRENIARTRIRAPFTGVLLNGDLHQSLGAPVAAGDVLFEIAPLDRYRVILEVNEQDVADVRAGLAGTLVVAALPGRELALRSDKMQPVAVAGDGRNYFRVDAELENPPAQLRPGMRGVAKLEIGPRRLLWSWTHRLFDRLRLWAWSLGW